MEIIYKNKKFFLNNNTISIECLLKEINLYKKEIIGIVLNKDIININGIINYDNTKKLLIEKLITINTKEGLNLLQNTTAHILAAAINNLYQNVKFINGSSIKEGFFYDFEFNEKISNKDLINIENEMKKILKNINNIQFNSINKTEAYKIFSNNEIYCKTLILDKIKSEQNIYLCKIDNFIDLCINPYLHNFEIIKNFKLLTITGAYLNNDAKNKMLTRIYGVVFFNENDLNKYIENLEKNKINDHNKIGRELNYFTTVPYIGKGLPVFLPKGAKTLQILQRYIEDLEYKHGYQLTKTPFLAKKSLYEISGHWQYYRENMIEINMYDEEYALRPMTCPFQFQVFLNKKVSYRDLPMRLNETSTLFRKELSGEMHGLIRLRQFTISEGHIICTFEQLKNEFLSSLDLSYNIIKKLKLDQKIYFRLSFYDDNNFEKYIGNKNQWDNIQSQMKEMISSKNIKYIEAKGEAAFYGPKLDIQINNTYGKEDTLITIQIDFELAKKFNMYYTNSLGKKEPPYIIHRTSIGCYERTLALLLEHYNGIFPLWLAPEQIKILLLNNDYISYANEINEILLNHGFRSFIDSRSKKLNVKIKDCYLEKIPYFIIIGENEKNNNIISFKKYGNNETYQTSIFSFIENLNNELKEN